MWLNSNKKSGPIFLDSDEKDLLPYLLCLVGNYIKKKKH